jgi:DNA-binding NtrC family response regulator
MSWKVPRALVGTLDTLLPVLARKLLSPYRGMSLIGITIVVVDAEPVVRTVIAHILERDGYRVLPFSDPQHALNVIKASAPSLVITNVYLPGMTGHEAMRMFKESCPGIPVLMVSGLPDSEIVQRWMSEDGFDAFPKPFSCNELSAKVRQLLGDAKQQ